MLVHGDQRRVGRDAHFRRLHQRDAVLSARRDHVHPVDDDLLGGGGDRHQAGRALAVDGHAGNADRATGAKRDLPADVAELRALRQHRAPDDVVDVACIDLGALDRGLEREAAQRRPRRGVEASLIGAPDGRPGGGNDDGVASQCLSPQTNIRPSHAAVSAGLSSPSISTVTVWRNSHCPGAFSSTESSVKRPRTRLPDLTGARKRIRSKP